VPWPPLLEGALAERARAVTDEIVAATHPDQLQVDDPALAMGAAGIALLHAYRAAADPRQGHEEAAQAWLDRAIDGVERLETPSLYGGFSGVAWAAAHLDGRVVEWEDDPNQEIDEVLLGLLGRVPWGWPYDLIVGTVGVGVYALERLPRPSAAALAARVLDQLEALAERVPEGLRWHTPHEHLPPIQRAGAPAGYYNLGLSHGVPGIVALLGALAAPAAPAELRARARPLLDGAVGWLRAQQRRAPGSRFSAWLVLPDCEAFDCRTAWCYGDPGVAAALVGAARGIDEPAWGAAALELARHAAARPPAESGVEDAALCHGAAGLGHVFHRLYRATGDPALGEAARRWLAAALELPRPTAPGLLEGKAGLALALLAATTPVVPAWDRMLLIDLPDLAASPPVQ
jgi:hypothetical protein